MPASSAQAMVFGESSPGTLGRILIGLDGTPFAEATLPHALAVARAFGSELWVIRVLESKAHFGATPDPVAWRLARAEAEGYLRTLAAVLSDQGFKVRTELPEGDAATEIVNLAERERMGLIVLGAQSRGEAGPLSLAGTSHRVISRSGTSVLLVRDAVGATAPALGQPIYHRVVVPVDGSKRAEWALCLAASLARSEGAELVIVSVAPIPETVRQPPLERRAQRLVDDLAALNRQWTEQYLDDMKNRLAGSGLSVRTVAASARHIRAALDPLLTPEQADLVVVSAHGATGGRRGRFGSVTSHLVHHGTTSLLVFQDLAPAALEPKANPRPTDDSRAHTGRHDVAL